VAITSAPCSYWFTRRGENGQLFESAWKFVNFKKCFHLKWIKMTGNELKWLKMN
jgi:hypothetical protein